MPITTLPTQTDDSVGAVKADGDEFTPEVSNERAARIVEIYEEVGLSDGSTASSINAKLLTRVTGPSSAADNAVARFDATTGKLIKDSSVTIDDAGNIATSGTVDGRDVSADGVKLDSIEAFADVTDAANVAAAGAVMTSRTISTTAPLTGGAALSGDLTLSMPAATSVNDGYATAAQVSKLDGIEDGADVTDSANVAAAGAVMDSDFAGLAVGVLTRTGVGSYAVIKDKLDATTAPGDNDDMMSGYAVGSRWIDVTNDHAYICVDASVGSAVWPQLDGSGGGGGSGDVVGPASATNNAMARFSLTTGKLIKSGPGTIDDSGNIATSGTINGRDVSVDGAKLDGIESGADVTDSVNVAMAGAVMTSRTISTTAPLTGGGALSGDLTIAIPAATAAVNGYATSTQISKLDSIEAGADVTDAANVAAAGAVMTSRQVISGGGLTGGGALSADRTLAVGANADGSIVVNADDIQVGVITDAQHGSRGGGSLHAAATTSTAGFLSSADKTLLDAVVDLAYSRRNRTIIVDEFDHAVEGFGESLDSGATFVRATDDAGAFGVYQAKLNTTAGAAVTLYTLGAMGTIGAGQLRIVGRLRPLTLADASNDYTISLGIGSSADPGATNLIAFVFDRTISTTDWQARTKAAGVATTTGTGVAVSTSYAYFEVIVNSGATSVEFKIGGSTVATHTTNIPATSTVMYNFFKFARVAGSPAFDRQVNIDLLLQDRSFSSAR